MRRPVDEYWLKLKERVSLRCQGKCEYCQIRRGWQLHHRTYAREGRERMSDVMLVCSSCHRIIHARLIDKSYRVSPRSLAHLGDSGFGTTRQWTQYLRNHPVARWRTAELASRLRALVAGRQPRQP